MGISGCSYYAWRQALSHQDVPVNLKSVVIEQGVNGSLHIHVAEP